MKNKLKIWSSIITLIVSAFAFWQVDWVDKTKQTANAINCSIGVILAVTSVAIAVYEIIDDKYDKLFKLTTKYKEFKIYKNITIGTIWDFEDNDNPANSKVYSIKGYLFELDNYFNKKEIALLIKKEVITSNDLELINFYKECKKIVLFPNYKQMHNQLLESTILSNDFG